MKNKNRYLPGLIAFILLGMVLGSCSTGADSAAATESGQDEPAEAPSATSPSPQAGSDAEDSATATAPAVLDCDLALPSDKDWPLILCETFDNNDHGWQVESQDNPYARYSIDVNDGKYELNYAAKTFAKYQQSALSWFNVASAQDFAISVTTLMNSDFQNCSWGLAFRASEDTFFLFSINNDNTYIFEIYEDNTWIPLITQRPFGGIQPNGENKLTVIAEREEFTFYINDQPVNTFTGGLLKGIDILLVVSAKEGVSVDYSFDDVVLQVSQ